LPPESRAADDPSLKDTEFRSFFIRLDQVWGFFLPDGLSLGGGKQQMPTGSLLRGRLSQSWLVFADIDRGLRDPQPIR
jgi:hypothetical protein